MSVTSAGALDIPVTAKAIAIGQEEGLVVEGRASELLKGTEVDRVEEGRDEDGGNHRRGLAWDLAESPACDRPDVMDEAGFSPNDIGRINRGHGSTSLS